MSKQYSNIDDAVFSRFRENEWVVRNIVTVPTNFEVIAKSEYIRVTTIADKFGINMNSARGMVNVDIFTPFGQGIKRYTQIADYLDALLVGKTIYLQDGSIQLGESALAPVGQDKANPSLHRTRYVINFNYFGVK